MSDYQINARLSLKDQMTAKLNSAIKATERLARGVGDAKDRELIWRVGVKGFDQLKRYQEMLKSAGMTQPKPVNLRVNDNGATSKINKIKTDLQSVVNRSWDATLNIKTNGAAALGKVKNNLSELATGAAFGLGAGMLGTAGIGYGAVNAIDIYKDFEYQMVRNKALFTTGLDVATAEKQYHDLEEAARYYGSTMKFTATEVAVAEEKMALAGWDAPTAIAALPAVLNAAVASGEDLKTVSDIITDDMTAMGYKAGTIIKNSMGESVEATQHFADVMLRTTLRSNTNFYELGLAMKYAAPLAHTLGFNMEEVAVALGLMANNGIKADQAGTGLRGFLNRFINEPKQAALSMQRLGVSMFDATGKAKGLMTMLMDVRAALKGGDADKMIDFAEEMTGEKLENRHEITEFIQEAKIRGGGKISEQDQAKLASKLSGTYALSAFMAIMNSTDEDIQKLMTEIYRKSDGTGAAIQKEMLNTLSGDLTTLKAAWEDFNIELFKGSGSSGIRDFVQGLTADINQFKNSLKDGLDFKDVFDLMSTALGQLKNKFLEFDGIGSILAGGALFMGLKKIASLALSIKDTLGTWSKARTASDIGDLLRGNKTPPIGSSQVGTMYVNAGVVNVNGVTKGGTPAGQSNQRGGVPPVGAPTTTGGTAGKTANQQRVDDYYRRRETILAQRGATPPATTVPPIIPPATAGTTAAETSTRAGAGSVLRSAAGGIAGGGILAAVFGALDVYSVKSQSQMSNAAADEQVKLAKQMLDEYRASGERQEDILAAQQSYKDALAAQKEIAIQNTNAERKAEYGAGGMVAGAIAGGIAGSFVPIIGNVVGGIIGGVLGQVLGNKAADAVNNMQGNGTSNSTEIPSIQAGSVAEFRGVDTGTLKEYQESLNPEVQAQQAENALSKYAGSMTRHQQIDRAEAKGSKIIDNDSKLEQARQHMHSAGYGYEQMKARAEMNEAVSNRENYYANERAKQQKMFGGMYAGEITPYAPKTDKETELLKRYDSQKAADFRRENEIQRQAIIENAKQAKNLSGQYEQSARVIQDQQTTSSALVARQKAFSDAFANKNSTSFLDSLKNIGSSIGDFFDGLLFNKAAASTLEEGKEYQLNIPEQTAMPEPVQPAEPSQGVSNFELPNIAEMVSNFELPDFGAKIAELFSGFELPKLGIAEKIQAESDGAGAVFDNFVMTVQASFANLGTGIQGYVDGAKSAITTAFNDAASQVQAAWTGMQGFFGGVFSGLGGIAASAGAAIYSGLTSVIGGIIGAWQSAASTISGIISSISAAASSAASAAGNFFGGGVGSNATGTASWKGGWTEVNEHGGEIINLPKGTQIIPHATTTKILRKEINQRLDNGEDNFHGIPFAKYGFMPEENKINPLDVKLPSGISSAPLSGDVIKPKVESSDGWRKNGNFTRDILGRIFQRGERAPLSGDVIYPRIDDGHIYGRKQNSTSTNLLESIFTGIFGRTPRQQSFKGLPSFSLPDIFDTFGSFDLPSLDFPSLPTASNTSTTNNQSSSNTLNINGVTINNGANEDEIFFHFQKMFNLAMVNSEQI